MRNPYKHGTKNWWIMNHLLAGKTREEILRLEYPLIMRQESPHIYSKNNPNGPRIPIKPVEAQIPVAFGLIGYIRETLTKRDNPELYQYFVTESASEYRNYTNKAWRMRFFNTLRNTESVIVDDDGSDPVEVHEIPAETPVEIKPEENTEDEQKPEDDRGTIRGEMRYLFRRLQELRSFVQSKKVGGRDFDYISTRAFVHGADAVLNGINADDFLWSIGASWPEDVRNQAGLNYTVDYGKYSIEGTAKLVGYVVRLLTAGIPVYLVGPTGSGKSVLARQVSEYLELDYAEIQLSLGVSRTDLFGNWNAQGFVDRPFQRLYSNGGVFCLEEIDGCDPNMLLSINNAIANEHLFNSSNGQTYQKHEEFYPIATANTWGAGATANYSGREGLDASTLDRFKYGRILVDYNTDIEWGIVDTKLTEYENEQSNSNGNKPRKAKPKAVTS